MTAQKFVNLLFLTLVLVFLYFGAQFVQTLSQFTGGF